MLIMDPRSDAEVAVDLWQIAKTYPACKRHDQNCTYWSYGSCHHKRHRCEVVSRSKRGLGVALGAL